MCAVAGARVHLAAGWARPPGAGTPRLGAGPAYAGKAACQRLGGVVALMPCKDHPATRCSSCSCKWASICCQRTRLSCAGPRPRSAGPVGGRSGRGLAGSGECCGTRWPPPTGRRPGKRAPTVAPGPGRGARTRPRPQVSHRPLLALRAPQWPGTSVGKRAPVVASAGRVWEPGGQLEGRLLCDDAAETCAQARERVRQCARCWFVEDFHKVLKTGLEAERLQWPQVPRLFTAAALPSAVAPVGPHEHSCQQPHASAETAGPQPAVYTSCGASESGLSNPCGTYPMPWPDRVGTWVLPAMDHLAGRRSGWDW